MRTRNILLLSFAVLGLLAFYLGFREDSATPGGENRQAQAPSTTRTTPQPAVPEPASSPRVPPFHSNAESAKPYPRILPADYFRGNPLVAQAYRIAALIPDVLAQQPCYCWCDKFGHGSLLDCFASQHGAG